MVDRPFEDVRPAGPIVDIDSSSSEEDQIVSQEHQKIIEQAENWYEEVSDEKKKKEMMIGYIDGITDETFPRSKAKRLVEQAGL